MYSNLGSSFYSTKSNRGSICLLVDEMCLVVVGNNRRPRPLFSTCVELIHWILCVQIIVQGSISAQ